MALKLDLKMTFVFRSSILSYESILGIIYLVIFTTRLH